MQPEVIEHVHHLVTLIHDNPGRGIIFDGQDVFVLRQLLTHHALLLQAQFDLERQCEELRTRMAASGSVS